jgi:FkbM family methyltransferase
MNWLARVATFWTLYLWTLPRAYTWYFFIGNRCFLWCSDHKLMTIDLLNFEDRFTVLDIYGKCAYHDRSLSQFIPVNVTEIVVFDFGANIGCSSLFFKILYPTARIIAIEPEPKNYLQLEKNVKKLSDIQLHQKALSQSTINSISLNHASLGNAHSVGISNKPEIDCISIRDLESKFSKNVNIAKIDIEGFESEVFSADHDLWNKFDVIMIELHDWMSRDITSTNFLKFCSVKKRRCIIKGDILFSYRGDLHALF